MSFSVLLLSVVFALIEAGLAWVMLAFHPVAAAVAGTPTWLLMSGIFALGMILSFIVIIVIGSLGIGNRAASFVRGHLGRTLALGLLATLMVSGLSLGGEALYQAPPFEGKPAAPQIADICFVLDYSSSMDYNAAEANMKDAFEQVIQNLPDGQQVCVVGYSSDASTLQGWTKLDAGSKQSVIAAVRNRSANGGTNFGAALQEADKRVLEAVNAGRPCAVVMLSDGECPIGDVKDVAPALTKNGIPVFTMLTSDKAGLDTSSLQKIADQTGGQMTFSALDVTSLATNIGMVIKQIAPVEEEDHIPDTLLTERNKGREGIINATALRIVILFLIAFAFKLTCVICVGDNHRFLGHFLHAFFIAALAAAAVEFGYVMGLPVFVVLLIFWLLMMGQIVLAR